MRCEPREILIFHVGEIRSDLVGCFGEEIRHGGECEEWRGEESEWERTGTGEDAGGEAGDEDVD